MKKFDKITRSTREVEVNEGGFYTENGEKLYRVETHGRTGKVLYRNGFYLSSVGKEFGPTGGGGSTGHGWGGQVCGYLLESELEQYGVK